MTLRKWNYETRKYEPYEVPTEWNVSLYSADMDELINCAECGEQLTFGDSYTSLDIHTSIGLGYGVCPKCHEKEIKRYREFKSKLPA